MAEPTVTPIPADGVPSTEAQEKQIEESPGIKIFAGNLDYSVNDEGLRKFFAPVESDILSCQVILRGNRSAGYGFVAVATEEALQKAVAELQGKDLEGRAAVVEKAKPAEEKAKEKSEKKAKRRTNRRGTKAVPGEVTEAEANGEVEKPAATDAEGGEQKPKKKKKKSARKLKNKIKDALTPGNNTEANGTAAEDAPVPAAEGEKRRAKPKRAPRPRRAEGEEPEGEKSKSKLFVANLPWDYDDAKLASIFSAYPVESARIVRHRYGHPRRSKGYGFVDVGEEHLEQAMNELQGKELVYEKGDTEKGTPDKTRPIVIKIAVNSKSEHESDVEKAEGFEGAAAEKAPEAKAPEAEAPAVASA